MITKLIDDSWIARVRENPNAMHWTQSELEKVVDAKVLLNGGYFVLVQTDFHAPKLVGFAGFRTEDVGETQKRALEMIGSPGMFESEMSLFKKYFPQSYEEGDFPHTDYTLWGCKGRSKTFANLRTYPEGSYLVDLIHAEAESSLGHEFNNSYTGPAGENGILKPEERTMTLPEFAKLNRWQPGSVVVQTADGELLDYDDAPMGAQEGLNELALREHNLQRALTQLRILLEECCVGYRKG